MAPLHRLVIDSSHNAQYNPEGILGIQISRSENTVKSLHAQTQRRL
jgi:hypothetical protein